MFVPVVVMFLQPATQGFNSAGNLRSEVSVTKYKFYVTHITRNFYTEKTGSDHHHTQTANLANFVTRDIFLTS